MRKLSAQAAYYPVGQKAPITWPKFWRAVETNTADLETPAKIAAICDVAQRLAFADDGLYFLLEF